MEIVRNAVERFKASGELSPETAATDVAWHDPPDFPDAKVHFGVKASSKRWVRGLTPGVSGRSNLTITLTQASASLCGAGNGAGARTLECGSSSRCVLSTCCATRR